MSKKKILTATLYKVEGTQEKIILEPKTRLATLQKLVGGYIEVICLVPFKEQKEENYTNAKDLVINEEGLLLNLPTNPFSRLVSKGTIWGREDFRGNIVLVDGCLP